MGLTASGTIQVGQELTPISKTISQRQIDCYSGVRPKSIHTDAEWARKKGFPNTLAQGMMSTAYVSEMMVTLLGEGYIKGGKMSVKFVKPVITGDTLTMHGTVREKQPDSGGVRIHVDLWCENQDGMKTMVGEASGLAAL